MLKIRYELFTRGLSVREAARLAHLAPESVSRIVNGRQRPGFDPGQSAERLAEAIGYAGDPRELFEPLEGGH